MNVSIEDIARWFDVPVSLITPCVGARVRLSGTPVVRSWPPGTPTGNLARLDALHERAGLGELWQASDVRLNIVPAPQMQTDEMRILSANVVRDIREEWMRQVREQEEVLTRQLITGYGTGVPRGITPPPVQQEEEYVMLFPIRDKMELDPPVWEEFKQRAIQDWKDRASQVGTLADTFTLEIYEPGDFPWEDEDGNLIPPTRYLRISGIVRP